MLVWYGNKLYEVARYFLIWTSCVWIGVGVDIPGLTQMACSLVCGLGEIGSNLVGNMLLDAGRPRPSKLSKPR